MLYTLFKLAILINTPFINTNLFSNLFITSYVIPAIILCTLTLTSFFIPFAQGKLSFSLLSFKSFPFNIIFQKEMQIGISILLSFAVFKQRLELIL